MAVALPPTGSAFWLRISAASERVGPSDDVLAKDTCVLGAYRRAHRLSDDQRHVRARLTVRDALVRIRTGYISVIRSLLRQHGWRVRSGAPESFSRRVRTLPLPGHLLSEIAPLLAVLRQVNHQL